MPLTFPFRHPFSKTSLFRRRFRCTEIVDFCTRVLRWRSAVDVDSRLSHIAGCEGRPLISYRMFNSAIALLRASSSCEASTSCATGSPERFLSTELCNTLKLVGLGLYALPVTGPISVPYPRSNPLRTRRFAEIAISINIGKLRYLSSIILLRHPFEQ